MARIPLELRIPAASPGFIGRDDEVEQLNALMERSAFVLVAGPGGIGKTALALHTVNQAIGKHRRRGFYFRAPRDEPVDQALRSLVLALAAWRGQEDELELGSDVLEATEALVDLAEVSKAWIVWDDVHHLGEEVSEVLTLLASHCHESRIMAISRVESKIPLVKERTVTIDRLKPTDMLALATALDPSGGTELLHRVAQQANGSPWVLKQLLELGEKGLQLSRDELLSDLSTPVVRLLESLSILRIPISTDELGAIHPVDPHDVSVALRRGLVVQDGECLRAHDVVAEIVAPERSRRIEFAKLLVAQPSAELRLEGVRVLLECDDAGHASGVLGEIGDEILAKGFAPRLFRVIGSVEDPRFALWRLRCAAQLGNATALGAARPPELVTESDRLAWAHAAYLSGEAKAAIDLTRDIPESTRRADLVARALLALGRADDAEEFIRKLNDPGVNALRLLVVARQGGTVTSELGDCARSTSSPAALVDLARAAFILDRHAEARDLLEQVYSHHQGSALAHYVTRRALLLEAKLDLACGRPDRAEQIIASTRPYVRGPTILRRELLTLDLERRLLVGDLERAEVIADRARTSAGDFWMDLSLRHLQARLADLRGHPTTPVGVARNGKTTNLQPKTINDQVWQCLIESSTHLLDAEIGAAQEKAARGVELASAHARAMLEAEARIALCDVLLCDRAPELSDVAAKLASLGEQIGSRRFMQEAAFYDSMGNPATLERLASAADVAPVAARRSQALLGADRVHLDRIDEMVRTAAAQMWGWGLEDLTTIGTTDFRSGWGADARHRTIWFFDGRSLSLSRKAIQWNIVTALAANGGDATKEDLVLAAWGEREYHPGRHDSKLHVAIRALRQAIEPDPSKPQFILTTETGYALRTPFRVLKLETQS